MTNTHYLEAELHSDFLKQERIDPITGEKIEEGHTIVICPACKSAFFIESWEYLGQTHCNQVETLTEIPKAKNMFLKAKPLEYLPFLFKKGNYERDDTIKTALENFLLVGAFLVGAFSLFFIAVIVGYYFMPLVGVISAFGVGGIIAAIMHSQKSNSLFKKKINPKKASYLALNAKKQAITIKKKAIEETINFEQIEQLNYSFNYIRSNNVADTLNYSLSLEIISNTNQKSNYYAVLHQDEIPYWSEFLEQLPYNLKVLNVR
ncbi:MAG: hypothetical protein COZ18_11950 [Flexibacter sp. CG_4_10_14_3_um_filter_32_15]|nr:MAG: hypothetical protein COZ18_11950 [Flexibacter sp. CG_4_10_14_3_um_filter_32_15]